MPDMKEDVEFSISHFRYKDSITEDIKQADLVISHAGEKTFPPLKAHCHLIT